MCMELYLSNLVYDVIMRYICVQRYYGMHDSVMYDTYISIYLLYVSLAVCHLPLIAQT